MVRLDFQRFDLCFHLIRYFVDECLKIRLDSTN